MDYYLTMRSEATTTDRREGPTFIETARRDQIVTAAIDTIAELGYGQSSLDRIASRARTSKGVICYHFAGKEELVKEVFAQVLTKAEAYMRRRIIAESTGPGMLRAYIKSNVGFIGEHRNHVVALGEIAHNARGADGSRPFDTSVLKASVDALQQLLGHLQRTGELRAGFDASLMAVAIRAAIDAAPPRLAADPKFDFGQYGRELADLFDLATRNPTGRR